MKLGFKFKNSDLKKGNSYEEKYEVFNIWKKFYNENNMRHLFIETPYFTAEYLNLWMKSDDDEIIMQIYDDMEGTAGHNLKTRMMFIVKI